MPNEATREHESRLLEALGIAESIVIRLRQIKEAVGDKHYGHVEQMEHYVRQLREIEDQVYAKGEYAPANRASIR